MTEIIITKTGPVAVESEEQKRELLQEAERIAQALEKAEQPKPKGWWQTLKSKF